LNLDDGVHAGRRQDRGRVPKFIGSSRRSPFKGRGRSVTRDRNRKYQHFNCRHEWTRGLKKKPGEPGGRGLMLRVRSASPMTGVSRNAKRGKKGDRSVQRYRLLGPFYTDERQGRPIDQGLRARRPIRRECRSILREGMLMPISSKRPIKRDNVMGEGKLIKPGKETNRLAGRVH